MISNFSRVLKVVFFILGDSPASEFYVPTFRNTLLNTTKTGQCSETSARKIQTPGITQKREYNNNVQCFLNRLIVKGWPCCSISSVSVFST
jgi:hypothetical protein